MVAWLGWSHIKCIVYWTEFLNLAVQIFFLRIDNIIDGQLCLRSSDVKDLTQLHVLLYTYIKRNLFKPI